MAVNPSLIVDAVAADIAANSGLSPKTTLLYAEPFVILPEETPLLGVWCEATEYDLLVSTPGVGTYGRRHEVNVAWYTGNALGAEYGGSGDPAAVQALDAATEALVARIASYAGGVPSFGQAILATLRSRRLTVSEGTLWEARVVFSAEETA